MPDRAGDVIVVGAGPAGLLAATRAAEGGRRTVLLEKNPRPGVKILMSGGTRCNVTHDTDARAIVAAFGRQQGPFLHSALAALSPADVREFLAAEGVATKVEEHGKVFPVSDRASDILAALLRRLRRSGAVLALTQAVVSINRTDTGFCVQAADRVWCAARVVLTPGGRSYPGCGTNGDGYAWAAALGHTIVPPQPALTPVTTDLAWVRDLRGITIPDVAIQVVAAPIPLDPSPKRKRGNHAATPTLPENPSNPTLLARARGSLLFTHFGLSGPPVLDVSRVISRHPAPRTLRLLCDFFPSERAEALRAWFDGQCAADGKRQLASILADRLPRRVVEAVLATAGIAADRRAAETARHDRQHALQLLQRLPIPISGVMGFRKAEVTAGGVSLEEVASRDMQSKLIPGLYFAGEVLDLDGPIGGYNFQAAFSTGWLAGTAVARVPSG